MGGQYGVDQSKKIAQLVGQFITVGYKVVKGNFLAIIELATVVSTLKTFDLDAFKKEASELDAGERAQLEQVFEMSLDIADNALEQKIVDASVLLNEAVDVVVHALSVIDEGKLVVSRFQDLIA